MRNFFQNNEKQGEILYLHQNPQKLLLSIHSAISSELNLFIKKHDFSVYTPNVGVFGENSTGKSTFLNAMLGNKDQFKMGFGETTNKITVLFEKKRPPAIKGIKQEYIRKNYRHLKYMNLFDIPGFGQQFSEVALRKVVKEMDVVFWFIDASKGVKKEDKLFLESIKGLSTKVIIVLNKIDAISENDDMEILLEEISREIEKIYTFFKEEKLEKNLVTVFPFSATKSLVETIIGKEGAFKVIDKIVQNVLLYTVFIESYRGYMASILIDRKSKGNISNINFDALTFKDNIFKIIFDASISLERKLKNKISIIDSFIPFFGKKSIAKPIVSNALINLNNDLRRHNERSLLGLNKKIEKTLKDMSSFDVFSESSKFQFRVEPISFILISIDLDSIAWSNLFGDSFAEDISRKFREKFKRKTNRQMSKIIQQYENAINEFQATLKVDVDNFANELDNEISRTTRKIQTPLLELLLKAVQKKLDDRDNMYIEEMLKI